MKTKAAILFELNKPLRLELIEIPALNEGQVLIKIHYSGVCHSQVMEARGKRGADNYLPHLLGHEAFGTVVEIGPSVKKVKVDDEVILGWIKSSGANAAGAIYKFGNHIINSGGVTTFSEYSVVSENRLVIKPEGVPGEVAVLFGCALPTGAGIVFNEINPIPGSSIAVIGLGGIGLSALIAAVIKGCYPIVAIDVSDEKLETAKRFGATHLINSRLEAVSAKTNEYTDGRGLDFAVEAAGFSHTIEQAFSLIRKNGGLCFFASHPAAGDKISLDPFELICGKSIKGSWGGGSKPDQDIPILADYYKKGEMPLEKLITRRYKLDDINSALNDLENKLVYRPLVEMK
jgi:S-(hydroxymethyl)glutathione dehydrogenase / alcohol dehydrogenase